MDYEKVIREEIKAKKQVGCKDESIYEFVAGMIHALWISREINADMNNKLIGITLKETVRKVIEE